MEIFSHATETAFLAVNAIDPDRNPAASLVANILFFGAILLGSVVYEALYAKRIKKELSLPCVLASVVIAAVALILECAATPAYDIVRVLCSAMSVGNFGVIGHNALPLLFCAALLISWTCLGWRMKLYRDSLWKAAPLR